MREGEGVEGKSILGVSEAIMYALLEEIYIYTRFSTFQKLPTAERQTHNVQGIEALGLPTPSSRLLENSRPFYLHVVNPLPV